MEMKHRLPGGGAVVPAHIDAIGVSFFPDDFRCALHGVDQLATFFSCRFGPRRDVALGHDECVAGRDWEGIPQREDVAVCVKDPVARHIPEWAGWRAQRASVFAAGRVDISSRPSSPALRHSPQRQTETERLAIQREPQTRHVWT